MKKLSLIILLTTSLNYAQTLKGIITINPLIGIGDETELSEKEKKPIYTSYTFSNNKSIQELISNESTSVDTIIVEHPDVEGLTMKTTKAIIRSNKLIIYKDYINDVFRLEGEKKNRQLITENTSIKDNIPTYNWTLQNETQTIIGYTCKKATAEKISFGRKQYITAWYTEEIPISDGPKIYNGLPGLILQVDNKNTLIKFEKLKFFKDTNTEIEAPKNESELISINGFQLQMMNK
ncbi:GLPGLI family protein [uncultured Formosa sp.]|uniref:GLPGLI family protein n=1 Tax=uncultured Formosa sp. TaxID=255435 RepID=UPI002630E870|nr:GLPGLI family protein [uncultured Formosa sp.]